MNEVYTDKKPVSKIGLLVGKKMGCASAVVGLYDGGAALRKEHLNKTIAEQWKNRRRFLGLYYCISMILYD